MKRLIIAAMAGALVAPAAFAGERYHDDDGDGHIEYARVVSVKPIYRQVEVRTPREECWDERVGYREGYDRYEGNQAGAAIAGGVAGGVAGHQFGQGRGRDAATVLGVLIGASIGQSFARDHTPPPVEHVQYEQRCETVPDSHFEDRVEGYDVTYRYHGRLYDTRMPYEPGDRIPVNVDVHPVSY